VIHARGLTLDDPGRAPYRDRIGHGIADHGGGMANRQERVAELMRDNRDELCVVHPGNRGNGRAHVRPSRVAIQCDNR
jgi:hypothetical protein